MTCNQLETFNGTLIDVRTPTEFQQARLSGAINVPLSDVDKIGNYVSQDDTLLLYCQTGQRSETAKNYLQQRGYDARNIGGIIHHMQCIEY